MQENRSMQRTATHAKASDWSREVIFDEGIVLEGDAAICSLATGKEIYKIEG
jgi:hypothetical protein